MQKRVSKRLGTEMSDFEIILNQNALTGSRAQQMA